MKSIQEMTTVQKRVANFLAKHEDSTVTLKEIADDFFKGKITPAKEAIREMIAAGWVRRMVSGVYTIEIGGMNAHSVVCIITGLRKAMDTQKKIEELEYAEDHFGKWIGESLSQFEKDKKEFAAEIIKNPEYALKWKSEGMVKSQTLFELASVAQNIYDRAIGEKKVDSVAIREAAEYIKEYCKRELYNGSFSHSSTCPMTNAHSIWKAEKYAQIAGGQFGSSISHIIKLITKG